MKVAYPFTEVSWRQTLVSLWKENRIKNYWKSLYELHDKEDQKYFDMLDDDLRRLSKNI